MTRPGVISFPSSSRRKPESRTRSVLGLVPAFGGVRRSDKRTGYTLTELMMVVAITGILFAAGPPMLVQLQNFWLMTSARYEIERDARITLDTMNRFLRQGKI